MTKDKSEYIDSLCKRYNIINYTINSDMTIDVGGNVDLSHNHLTKLPLLFNDVSGNFICGNNYLTSLIGSPINIGLGFDCRVNLLTSLEFCPNQVGNFFDCSGNKLISLEGCPGKVGGDFDFSYNVLTSLVYCPVDIGGYFYYKNNKLPFEFTSHIIDFTSQEQQLLLKYQHYFDVWTPDFNKAGMNDLVAEIKDGLR
jgi:hypothetical protein